MALTFEAEDYRAAVEEYHRGWELLDSVLYRVCGEHPSHSEIAGVTAKVFLIGRTYQTGIERQMKSDGTQAGAMTRLANYLFAHRQEVDALIAPFWVSKAESMPTPSRAWPRRTRDWWIC